MFDHVRSVACLRKQHGDALQKRPATALPNWLCCKMDYLPLTHPSATYLFVCSKGFVSWVDLYEAGNRSP